MLADQLIRNGKLKEEEYKELLTTCSKEESECIREAADKIRKQYYGTKVYVRGLIEYTNYCRNNCYYCGIRAGNKNLTRYRLTGQEILECCRGGYQLGLRTFVLQGGEDPMDRIERLADMVYEIKRHFPDCAVTLSVGERSRKDYQILREAGADRYLLRHETADERHYRILHPEPMSLEHRKECLSQLKSLGYQTGAGFMVGSPGQTNECLAKDLIYLSKLKPEMVGIGPFLPHHDTPFGDREPGNVEKTLLLLSIVRIILPAALIPATTALSTAWEEGRELGLKAGANVIMPNLSPCWVRKQYALYDGKKYSGDESAKSISLLKQNIEKAGYELVFDRGDAVNI